MILLDTHIWIWWVHGDENLTESQEQIILASEEEGIGVSAISCWEVAKLVEYGRLELPCSIEEWFEQALSYPGVKVLELSPEIAKPPSRPSPVIRCWGTGASAGAGAGA